MPSYLSILNTQGSAITQNLFSSTEIENIISIIDAVERKGDNYRQTEGLFAIRRLLTSIPSLVPILFSDKVKQLTQSFGDGYFLSKSIYFDKPPQSNWFVAYHQDLTLNCKEKIEADGFKNWTNKNGFYAVQPPVEYLQNTITVRIHLDDTNENNGALWVKPKSHLNGVIRLENLENTNGDSICNVNKGSCMLMKPLLFHASKRSTNNKQRRVIHLEFNNMQLPNGLEWDEKIEL